MMSEAIIRVPCVSTARDWAQSPEQANALADAMVKNALETAKFYLVSATGDNYVEWVKSGTTIQPHEIRIQFMTLEDKQ